MPNDSTLPILLVEDDLINSQLFQMMLQRLGYVVDLASDGQDALDKISLRKYQVILMDCQMPVLDGFAATQKLREREGDQEHQIVIGLTAHTVAEARDRCLAAGMDDYLAKPLKINDLQATLEKWIGS